MAESLLLKNGRLVLASGVVEADLLIKGEKIAGIQRPAAGLEAEQVIDAAGKIIMPGVIDPHVHLGYGKHPDDYTTETASAALGGVTTVMSFNWSLDSYQDWFVQNKALAESMSHLDFAFHGGLVKNEQFGEMGKLHKECGISSFKFLMQYMSVGGRKKNIALNYADMYELFEQRAALGKGVICVHCEDPELIARLSARMKTSDAPDAWLRSRPGFTEARGVQCLLDFMKETGSPAYVVHLSSKEALELIRAYRRTPGLPRLWVETCPHYLMLTWKDSQGNYGKVNPPLRNPEDNEALWQAVAEGTIDTIGSDHIARPEDKKQGSIWDALAGFPGSHAILPVMFAEGHLKRGIPLERIAELTSTNAAKIFSLYPRKGVIQVGSDADLVMVDPDRTGGFRPEALRSLSSYSLYRDLKPRGWPVMTMVRGREVMSEGEIVGPPGHGKYLPR